MVRKVGTHPLYGKGLGLPPTPLVPSEINFKKTSKNIDLADYNQKNRACGAKTSFLVFLERLAALYIKNFAPAAQNFGAEY